MFYLAEVGVLPTGVYVPPAEACAPPADEKVTGKQIFCHAGNLSAPANDISLKIRLSIGKVEACTAAAWDYTLKVDVSNSDFLDCITRIWDGGTGMWNGGSRMGTADNLRDRRNFFPVGADLMCPPVL